MRRIRRLSLLLVGVLPVLFLSHAPLHATPPVTTMTASATTGEAEIRAWLDRWAKAFAAHDVDGVRALYAPGVIAYDIIPPLQYVGREAYGKDYAEGMAQYTGPIEVEFRDLHIGVEGNLAYATTLERIGGTLTTGERSDVWVRATSIFRKTNGRWLDVHDHVSVPADFATGKAALDLTP